ncbi:hypothetical protein [Marinobacterium stanieri]|uniref:Uncharacterized protein n=1 Tax=Marinobacterium stanieri TaxID=49186 RepID=A0A1N6NJ87_9GAMM|nr:hypothetical protein [Marinobacterium stanieri]SIP92149.1 hypothetical protein SAMN05421647_101361 [Marinobacterium stanieri]
MNTVNWTLSTLVAALLFMPGCSQNPPMEPVGLAVEEMRQAQTYDAYAADTPRQMRLDGEKAQQVMTGYRSEAQSAKGVQGDIEINIGN